MRFKFRPQGPARKIKETYPLNPMASNVYGSRAVSILECGHAVVRSMINAKASKMSLCNLCGKAARAERIAAKAKEREEREAAKAQKIQTSDTKLAQKLVALEKGRQILAARRARGSAPKGGPTLQDVMAALANLTGQISKLGDRVTQVEEVTTKPNGVDEA